MVIVAEKDGIITGFGDIDKSGYLDRLYVHKDFQNMKIGKNICDRLEEWVLTDEITVHSSITAKGFFIHRGYKVINEQQVERKGIKLTNFVMVKRKQYIRVAMHKKRTDLCDLKTNSRGGK